MSLVSITRIVIFFILIFFTLFRLYTFYNSKTIENEIIKRNNTYILNEAQNINIEVISNVDMKDNSQSFVAIDQSNSKKIKVTTNRYEEISFGDIIEIRGKVIMPRNFRSESGLEFDYINFLAKDRIYFEIKNAEILSKINFDVSDAGTGKSIKASLFRIKKRFSDNVKSSLPEPYSSLANGLVIGEKSSLGRELLDDFRDAGLVHIIVLSGFNITIISSMIRLLFTLFPRRVGIILGGIALILFGVLVGGGATVVRSCIMAGISLLGEFLYRPYSAWVGIILAGLLMIIHNPAILFHDPSFQLSFLATLGLMTFSGLFQKILFFIPENMNIRETVSSTLATQISVTPLLIRMMGEISVVGIFVNVIILPFVPLTMLFVFLCGVSPWFGMIASFPAFFLLHYILKVVEYASALPWAVYRF